MATEEAEGEGLRFKQNNFKNWLAVLLQSIYIKGHSSWGIVNKLQRKDQNHIRAERKVMSAWCSTQNKEKGIMKLNRDLTQWAGHLQCQPFTI